MGVVRVVHPLAPAAVHDDADHVALGAVGGAEKFGGEEFLEGVLAVVAAHYEAEDGAAEGGVHALFFGLAEEFLVECGGGFGRVVCSAPL